MTAPLRLRAPATDGGLLALPSPADAPALLEANAAALDVWGYDFQGRSARMLRGGLRAEILRRAAAHHDAYEIDRPASADPATPLIVTGHQPELFHPGVWVKNFAVAELAGRLGGVGLNLIVDNDVPKTWSIRVPTTADGGLRARSVEFDDRGGDVPYEDLMVHGEATFATFPDRVRATLGDLVADPIIEPFWPGLIDATARTDRVGLRFALARRRLEADWGVHNWELPLSSLCESDGFLWFVAHLLAQLPRFQAVHNEALRRYREAHGIRSRNHPVPALGGEGDWREAPFWVWRADRPRRRPLLARQRGRVVDLRIAGEAGTLIELPLSPDMEGCCAVERLKELPGLGVRLRTRALTTTMFARLLLTDLFLHGIGGAKYDELGDEVVRGFFGIEPPGFQTLSLTAWPGLDPGPASEDDRRRIDRRLRDLEFKADQFLGSDPRAEVAAAVAAKRAALAMPVETRRQRSSRAMAIRDRNRDLAPFVADRRAELRAERERVVDQLRRGGIARSREFSLVVHPANRLRATLRAAVRPENDAAGSP